MKLITQLGIRGVIIYVFNYIKYLLLFSKWIRVNNQVSSLLFLSNFHHQQNAIFRIEHWYSSDLYHHWYYCAEIPRAPAHSASNTSEGEAIIEWKNSVIKLINKFQLIVDYGTGEVSKRWTSAFRKKGK